VAVEEDANVRLFTVAIADLWKFKKGFCALVNRTHGAARGLGIVLSDVIVDFLQPSTSFGSPDYFRHESTVFFISS
jgi:hypothetical protein